MLFLLPDFQCPEAVSADGHGIADEPKQLRWDQLRIAQVVNGQVFGAKVQILRRTVQGICALRTAWNAEWLKEKRPSWMPFLDYAPQPRIRCQQVKCGQQSIIPLSHPFNRRPKGRLMPPIFEYHRVSLAFL